MSARDDGGPAFPKPETRTSPITGISRTESAGGMTLRDYFAAKAMQARLADAVIPTDEVESRIALLASGAYRMADAMLKARQQ